MADGFLVFSGPSATPPPSELADRPTAFMAACSYVVFSANFDAVRFSVEFNFLVCGFVLAFCPFISRPIGPTAVLLLRSLGSLFLCVSWTFT